MSFSDGITEDIITDLSKIKELKVVSRTDVLPFRNKEVNTRKVGETLRVNYILEGSVRTAGNRIRINTQLIYPPVDGTVEALLASSGTDLAERIGLR